jgi:hypothetical protein
VSSIALVCPAACGSIVGTRRDVRTVDPARQSHGVCAERLGQQQLLLDDVRRDDGGAGELGRADGEVAETPDTEHATTSDVRAPDS